MSKKSIKDRSLNVLKSTIKLVSLTVETVIRATLIASFAGAVVIIGAKAPEIHGYWIRAKVGAKTYTVRNKINGGGGTGFAMKGRSGASYIVTNDHVCESSKDKRTMLVIDDEGNYLRRNILYRSDKSDLCLLEGMPGVEGLELGNAPTTGQVVAAVGHPALRPTTLSRGEIIGTEDVEIPTALIGEESDDGGGWDMPTVTREECSLAKNKIRKVMTFFGPLELCMNVTYGAYLSNALIQPGSSGSPVVNFWGNVVGVVFAGDRYGWGIFVSHTDLKELLRMY